MCNEGHTPQSHRANERGLEKLMELRERERERERGRVRERERKGRERWR